MTYFIYAIPMVEITMLLLFIYRYIKDNNKNIHSKIIKQPKLYQQGGFIISFLGIILSLFIVFAGAIEQEDKLIAVIVLFAYTMIGFILLLFYHTWAIKVFDTLFTFQPFIGKKRHYEFTQVRYYPQSAHKVIYGDDMKVIKIPYLSQDSHILIHKLEMIDAKKELKDTNKTYQLSYNKFTLWISLVFLGIGLILVVAVILGILYERDEMLVQSSDVFFTIFSLVFGILTAALGIIGLSFYFGWKMLFHKDHVIYYAVFRKRKVFMYHDVTYSFTKHGYLIHLTKEKSVYVNEGFVDHTFLIHALKIKQQTDSS